MTASWSRQSWAIWWLRFGDRESAAGAVRWAEDRDMTVKLYESDRGVLVAMLHNVDELPEIEAAWGRSKRYRRHSDVR